MSEGERINKLRSEVARIEGKSKPLTMDEFGDRIGVQRSWVSKVENGQRHLTNQMISAICNVYGVREEWLRDGAGDIFIKKSAEDELNALADKVMADTPESFRRRFVSMLAKLTDEQWKVLSEMEDMMLALRDERSSGSAPAAADQPLTEADLHAELQREIDTQKKVEGKSTGSDSIAG